VLEQGQRVPRVCWDELSLPFILALPNSTRTYPYDAGYYYNNQSRSLDTFELTGRLYLDIVFLHLGKGEW
jgi:hypothetical protein